MEFNESIKIKDDKLKGYIYWQTDKITPDCVMIDIDRVGLYDKPSKCPIRVPFPKTIKEFDILMKKIEWLKTKEGYEASKNYDTKLWLNNYD